MLVTAKGGKPDLSAAVIATYGEILIEKGMYATALDMISRYGYEGIKTESLMKLTSYLILDYDFVEQEELVYLAQAVFRTFFENLIDQFFLLFYDEILEYYLTVELPDDTRQTEKKLLTMEESLQEGNTKYQLINQMLAGRKLGRREQTEKAMEQYLQREHFARKMFPVLHA